MGYHERQVIIFFRVHCIGTSRSHQIIAIELDESLIKAVGPTQPKINPGEIVHLDFKQETLRFFEPETEMSIDLPID